MKKVGALLCALFWCTQVTPCDLGFFALLNTIKNGVQKCYRRCKRAPQEYVKIDDMHVELVGLEQNKQDRLVEQKWRSGRRVHFRDFTTDWLTPISEES